MVVGAAAAFAVREESRTTEVTVSPSSAPTGVESATAQKPEYRALTVDDPMRLWIGGDSLAGSLGPSLGETVAATGVVAPRFDSRVSSGLTSPEFFDWPEHAAGEMASRDPEAVVFIIDTNDAVAMPDLATADDAAEITAGYAARVEEMMQIFIGDDHRPVYWVATPPMKDTDLDDNVDVLNGVIADVAARHPEVTFIDVSTEFSDSDGDFTTSVTDETGDRVLLRAGDGIHLTPEGGDRMAAPVFAAIDADWRTTTQAVPGNTQPILETEGSSRIAGTSRGSSGSSGSGSGSSGSGSSGSGGSGTTSTTSAPVEETPPETTPPPTEPPPDTTTTTTTPASGTGNPAP